MVPTYILAYIIDIIGLHAPAPHTGRFENPVFWTFFFHQYVCYNTTSRICVMFNSVLKSNTYKHEIVGNCGHFRSSGLATSIVYL